MLTINYPNASITVYEGEKDAIQSHLKRAQSLSLPVEKIDNQIIITNLDGSKCTLKSQNSVG